jgi:hypothetical protein
MPLYLIERTVPGAGDLRAEELQVIASTSNAVVDELSVPYVWHVSYVAGDKIYCVHEAPDPETVAEHARRGGFPADSITEIANIIDPRTAEAPPCGGRR